MLIALGAAEAAKPLSVDVNGTLQQAVRVLQARHGVSIDLELPPPDHDRDEVVQEGEFGLFVVDRVRGLRFEYEGGVDEGLAAAIIAWEAAGGPGTYQVETTAWGRRIVATGRTGPDGTMVPYESPLDCVITEPALVGTDGWLMAWLVADINAQCGQRLVNLHDGGQVRPLSRVPLAERPEDDPDRASRPFELPAFQGPVRDRLDDLAKVTGSSSYRLSWSRDRPLLWIGTSAPEDEVRNNQASITGLGDHPGPVPPLAPSSKTYGDYLADLRVRGVDWSWPEPGEERIPFNPFGFAMQPPPPERPVPPPR